MNFVKYPYGTNIKRLKIYSGFKPKKGPVQKPHVALPLASRKADVEERKDDVETWKRITASSDTAVCLSAGNILSCREYAYVQSAS
jgi:hypothetical protein